MCALSLAMGVTGGSSALLTPPDRFSIGAADTTAVDSVAADSTRAQPAAGPQKGMATIVLKGGGSIRGYLISLDPPRVKISDSVVVPLSLDNILSITFDTPGGSQPPISGQSRLEPSTSETPAPSRSRADSPGFSLLGGLAIPLGDFGVTSNSAEGAGYANTGYALGFEFNGAGTIAQAALEGFVAVNGSEMGSSIQGDYSGISLSAESSPWINIWLLGGVRLGGSTSEDVHICGEGLVGLLIGMSPTLNLTARYGTNTVMQKIPSSSVATAGYGAGFSMTSSHVAIAVRYLTGKPEYELNSGTQSIGKIEQSTSVFFLMVGYRF
jgi:hypothetical protein